MHDDMTAILKCYTEEAVSKSRKAKGPGRKHRRNNENEKQNEIANNTSTPVKLESEEDSKDNATGLLSALSDDQLLKELARRKANHFRLAGAMKRLDNKDGSRPLSEQPCEDHIV